MQHVRIKNFPHESQHFIKIDKKYHNGRTMKDSKSLTPQHAVTPQMGSATEIVIPERQDSAVDSPSTCLSPPTQIVLLLMLIPLVFWLIIALFWDLPETPTVMIILLLIFSVIADLAFIYFLCRFFNRPFSVIEDHRAEDIELHPYV
mmetsp:Transcript_8742/g.16670  ORF Transcript_8742/g.16670 Transcript_8742/m.16670 type:complete len:147 (-) Transcript_8742:614-1054(-)